MDVRKDALAGAAEAVLIVERLCRDTEDLVGVVGELAVTPGSVNVVPARCDLTVELRSPRPEVRLHARDTVTKALDIIARERGLEVEHELTYEAEGFACAPRLVAALEQAVAACGHRPKRLFSGAGHDGLAMRELTECGMLFVRCRDGLSHHPDEAITAADVQAAGEVLIAFLESFTPATGMHRD
jgi:allantoate deiminase